MSLLSAAYLIERYGLRLTVEDLAEVLDITPGAVRNQVSARTFPIPTYVEGNRRFADYRDVAAHFDAARAKARSDAGTPA
jgi:hypothetical protein